MSTVTRIPRMHGLPPTTFGSKVIRSSCGRVRFAQKLGKALRQLTTIVAPSTLLRWIREEKRKPNHKPAKRGRSRTPEQILRLILKLARENHWGYTRILGELKRLGIHSVSRNTVKAILKEHGLDPGPKRGEGTGTIF